MKPTCIIHGNCHAIHIYDMLRKFKGLTQEYTLCAFRRGENTFHCAEPLSDAEALANCAIFLRQKTFWDDPFPHEELLPPSCRVISYPMLSGELLWPFFMGHPLPLPYGVESNRRRFHCDRLLHRLQKQHPSPREALQAYLTTDIHTLVDLDRGCEAYFDKIRTLDRECDVAVADLIEARFRHRHLFFDTSHPTEHFLFEIACLALQAAGLSFAFRSDDPPTTDLSITVPIHPQVIDHYGLTFVNHSARYGFHRPEPFTTNLFANGHETKDGDFTFIGSLRRHLGLPDITRFEGEGNLQDHLAALQAQRDFADSLQALPAFQGCLDTFRAEVLTALADSHFAAGEKELAAAHHTAALAADAGFYPLLLSRLHFHQQTGHPEQAMEALFAFADSPGFCTLSLQEWLFLARVAANLYDALMRDLLAGNKLQQAKACHDGFSRLFPRLGLGGTKENPS
ncbi:MAG: hypothetical protein HQL64_13735 [Magnetococcales bacterium]|nr:hypothetical protein [Magnetococcales bacterium]